jgi:hypothetical protein
MEDNGRRRYDAPIPNKLTQGEEKEEHTYLKPKVCKRFKFKYIQRDISRYTLPQNSRIGAPTLLLYNSIL